MIAYSESEIEKSKTEIDKTTERNEKRVDETHERNRRNKAKSSHK